MLNILRRFFVFVFLRVVLALYKEQNNKQLFPSSFSSYIPEGSLQVRIRLMKGNPWRKSICLTCWFVDVHLGGVYVLCVYSHAR